ncbi:MAG: hypothetical protein V4610_23350 [Pseudomonadota bacterium]|uniref:Uncharacterized protein n=1 Tax=hydrothermal vent metagenome TaxID=652676 RepID=A0A160TQP0_9ZZZZ
MEDDLDHRSRDEWQTRLCEASHRFSTALKELHQTNPWPENPTLEQAINMLATELWDRGFSQTDIGSAFRNALADLPRYTAGDEVRP